MPSNKKRGPKYKPIDLAVLQRHASTGISQEDIARLMGINRLTLHRAMLRDTAIRRAWELGKAKGIRYVIGKLMAQIKDGNTAAIIFYLKAQAGWSERIRMDAQMKIDDNELDDAIARSLERLAEREKAILAPPIK